MAIVFAYNLVCLLTMAAVTQMLFYGLPMFSFLIMSLVICQIFQIVMIGGLLGKSALAGIGWASLLGFCTAMATMPTEMYWGAYRSLLVLPFAICVGSAPPLLARFLWGWQLIEHPSETIPFRRMAMEDFFLLTACVAAIFVLLIDSSPRYESRGPFMVDPRGMMFTVLVAIASVPVLGVVYMHFRRGLDASSTFLLLLGLYLPPYLFICVVTGFRAPWILWGAPLCALGSSLTLWVYKVGGYRLVRFHDGIQREPDELSEAERFYIAESRRSARVSMILLLITTAAAVAIHSAVDSSMSKEMPSRQHAN